MYNVAALRHFKLKIFEIHSRTTRSHLVFNSQTQNLEALALQAFKAKWHLAA